MEPARDLRALPNENRQVAFVAQGYAADLDGNAVCFGHAASHCSLAAMPEAIRRAYASLEPVGQAWSMKAKIRGPPARG